MLSARANSFRLKSRLAISLSWIAGFTNVIALIVCGQVVSHQTGNSTHLGSAVGGLLVHQSGAAADIRYFSFLVVTFWLGAVCSGFLTASARHSGRSSKYRLPMLVESALLAILLMELLHHPHPAAGSTLYFCTGIAAFAMGLQNATITQISGAVVRTTHLTGVITDLGLESVQLFHWWRDKMNSPGSTRYFRILKITHRQPSAQRVALLSSIIGSFFFGSALGTIALIKWGPIVLAAPILFLLWIAAPSFSPTGAPQP